MNTSASTSTAARQSTPRPWWLELFFADFRNALLPWLVFASAVIALPWKIMQPQAYEQLLMGIIMLAAPAMVTAVFSADFTHSTMATLLGFPLRRQQIWLCRCLGTGLLLLTPYLLGVILHLPFVSPEALQPSFNLYPPAVFFNYVHFCSAAILSVLLRRSVLVWSTAIISPVVLLLLFLLVTKLLPIQWGRFPTSGFPWMPLDFPLFGSFVSTMGMLWVFKKWQRLEVTQ